MKRHILIGFLAAAFSASPALAALKVGDAAPDFSAAGSLGGKDFTFKMKDAYLDMTGLANVRWFTKTTGFHSVRPVIKLADGNLLVGDLEFESVAKLTLHEFSLLNIRWIKLDPERVVTVPPGRVSGNPNMGIWFPNVDLSKIDEIGFVDLIPGSGHGQGGYIQLAGIEVNGKKVPR